MKEMMNDARLGQYARVSVVRHGGRRANGAPDFSRSRTSQCGRADLGLGVREPLAGAGAGMCGIAAVRQHGRL